MRDWTGTFSLRCVRLRLTASWCILFRMATSSAGVVGRALGGLM